MVGGALLGTAANRQVCPTISEMTFGTSLAKQERMAPGNGQPNAIRRYRAIQQIGNLRYSACPRGVVRRPWQVAPPPVGYCLAGLLSLLGASVGGGGGTRGLAGSLATAVSEGGRSPAV